MSDEKQRGISNVDRSASRVPLTPLAARHAVLKCFEEQDQWTRKELTKAVEARHFKAGGYAGTQPTVQVVKKVLGELRAEGLVQPVSKGIWRYVEDSDPSTEGPTSTEAIPDDISLEEDEEPGGLQISEEIGAGRESVYLYYNPNDFRLAQTEGRSTWECKIGHTVGLVDVRILGQGVRTALSHSPVVALVIRTDDARTLESVLHRSLRLADSTIVDASPEWFMTSPDRVKAWYYAYMASVDHLARDAQCDNSQRHRERSQHEEGIGKETG
jgi:hypothetical protein